MTKKIFALSLILILIVHGAAFAKTKEIPPEKKIKIAVEIFDSTEFVELDAPKYFRGLLINQLDKKKIFDIVNATNEEKIFDTKTLETSGAADIGELLIISPPTSGGTGDISALNMDDFKKIGADYVVRCEIRGLGLTKTSGDTAGIDPGIGIGVGSHHIGVGIFGAIPRTERTIFATVVSLQFIKVDSGVVLFRHNFIGQALKHRKPSKGYEDASDEAFLKSAKNAAENISKQVGNYASKHLLKD